MNSQKVVKKRWNFKEFITFLKVPKIHYDQIHIFYCFDTRPVGGAQGLVLTLLSWITSKDVQIFMEYWESTQVGCIQDKPSIHCTIDLALDPFLELKFDKALIGVSTALRWLNPS